LFDGGKFFVIPEMFEGKCKQCDIMREVKEKEVKVALAENINPNTAKDVLEERFYEAIPEADEIKGRIDRLPDGEEKEELARRYAEYETYFRVLSDDVAEAERRIAMKKAQTTGEMGSTAVQAANEAIIVSGDDIAGALEPMKKPEEDNIGFSINHGPLQTGTMADATQAAKEAREDGAA